MTTNALLVCALALLHQSAVGQYLSRVGGCGCGGVGNALGYGGIGYNGYAGNDIGAAGALGASNGGCLNVISSSAAPTSLGVASENSYEGTVGVCGNLPLLGTAVVTGEFPTGGLGGINYGCGNGAVGITAEDRAGIGYAGGLGYGSGYGLGYGGYAGNGCGCGGAY